MVVGTGVGVAVGEEVGVGVGAGVWVGARVGVVVGTGVGVVVGWEVGVATGVGIGVAVGADGVQAINKATAAQHSIARLTKEPADFVIKENILSKDMKICLLQSYSHVCGRVAPFYRRPSLPSNLCAVPASLHGRCGPGEGEVYVFTQDFPVGHHSDQALVWRAGPDSF